MKYLKTFENKEPEKSIKYYNNGNIKSIGHKLNGNLHREDGPAYLHWKNDGKLNLKIYYINGYSYKKEDWINKLKEINSSHYKEQKILYDMEKYNL